MPQRPQRPCLSPNCNEIAPSGESFCEACKDAKNAAKRAYDQVRGSASSRGYNYKWRRTRERWIKSHPLCRNPYSVHPEPRSTQEVDHIIPHKGDMKLFWDRDNWQPLCSECHKHKTAKERLGKL